ncbi:hypothetical protein BDV93DRAFT_428001, partial [Ceratobasidium sp. AG-I]
RLSGETTVLVESHTLPDGRTTKVGPTCFDAPECMFQPHLVDIERPGVADPSLSSHISSISNHINSPLELLFWMIQAAAVDAHAKLYGYIVRSGWFSMYSSLAS